MTTVLLPHDTDHPMPLLDRPTSPWVTFDRSEWAKLRAATPLTLTEEDVEHLRGLNESLDLEEVAEVYLPLSRLVNLYVAAMQNLHRVTDVFLGGPAEKVPFVIAVAGSVAVGKSTTSRVLQALLRRWPDHPTVELVTTDGFLHPNAVLEERGLMDRKGFPESYDLSRLLAFIADVKSGREVVHAPIYSHLTYDIVPDESLEVRRPDILILEGLNVLQTPSTRSATPDVFVSDFFDLSVFVDAEEDAIRQWYLDRFLTLRDTAFKDPRSYFRKYAATPEDRAVEIAESIWDTINGPNLRENILPTRGRADVILHKRADHSVDRVQLRKL